MEAEEEDEGEEERERGVKSEMVVVSPPFAASEDSSSKSREEQQQQQQQREETKPFERIEWPRPNKTKQPGDILFWPRTDQPIAYTHWAVYIGRRKPMGNKFVENESFPEAVVHLWGAADAKDRSMSKDAAVIYSELSEVNCEKDAPRPFCGNYKYDSLYTPMRPSQILHRTFVALEHKFYEKRIRRHFATWARYGFQHSSQVGDVLTTGLSALGTFMMGPPGLALGYIAGNLVQDETRKARRHKNNQLDEAIRSNETRNDSGGQRRRILDDIRNSRRRGHSRLFGREKEVDWTVDCLLDYVETSNVQFSQEKHDKYEQHDKHRDDNRPFRVSLKAADENSALYKDRKSSAGQTNIIDVDSRGEVRLGGKAQPKPETDLKELAKDLGKIGKEVGKGMLSMLGWVAHEALEGAKKRQEARVKREKEALEKLEKLKVQSSSSAPAAPSNTANDENNQSSASNSNEDRF
ncbi:unnamed protein product [Bathycoccus prasinos]